MFDWLITVILTIVIIAIIKWLADLYDKLQALIIGPASSPLPPQIDMTGQNFIQIFQAEGKIENANIKLTEDQITVESGIQYFLLNYDGKSSSFKNVTFEYATKTKAYIKLDVNDGQQVEVENCSFHGVGLMVYGDGGDASITNSTFTDIKLLGLMFINMRSVQVSEVGMKNCEKTAVSCFDVKKFVGKKMNIQNSDIGFEFYNCLEAQLELHDTNIQNCKNPIRLKESANVKQHNVNIIS